MKHTQHWSGVILILLAFALRAPGHDVGLSTAVIQLQATGVQVTVSFAIRDLNALADLDADHDGAVTPAEFAAAQPLINRTLTAGCLVSNANRRLTPAAIHSRLAEADNIETQLVFPASKTVGEISFPVLRELPAGHRMFVRLVGVAGETLAELLINRDSPPIALPATDSRNERAPKVPHTFAGFLRLGVEHIGTGYDHLFFLFGLLLVTRRLKSALAVITSFTVAHSLTLAAATLNLVALRPAITEPLIALSIVYVGVENLARHGEPKHRWLLTFAFGLIHGFGFASVLHDLGVGAGGGAVLPLFSFNLGVELGQLAVAAIFLPLIWQMAVRPHFQRRWLPASCAVIIAAGGFWFCQRVG